MRATLAASRRWAFELGARLDHSLAVRDAAANTVIGRCRTWLAATRARKAACAAVVIQAWARSRLTRRSLRRTAARERAACRLQAARRGYRTRAVLLALGAEAREHVEVLRKQMAEARSRPMPRHGCHYGQAMVKDKMNFAPKPPALPKARSFDIALPEASQVFAVAVCLRYAVGGANTPCVPQRCPTSIKGVWWRSRCVCC